MAADYEGDITMVNEALTNMVGYSRDELVGKSTATFLPKGEDYRVAIGKFLTQLFEEGVVFAYEFTYLKKDGNLMDVELSAALLKDKEGNITGSVSSIRDITERKKSEEALKKSEEKYYNLIEHANDAIVSTDQEGNIIEFNKKAKEMFGYQREEIMGRSAILLAPPSERAKQRDFEDKTR